MVVGLVCHEVLLAPNPDHPPWQPICHALHRHPLSHIILTTLSGTSWHSGKQSSHVFLAPPGA